MGEWCTKKELNISVLLLFEDQEFFIVAAICSNMNAE